MKNVDLKIALLVLLLISVFQLRALADSQFPKPVGFVNDFAGVIDPAHAQQIEAICQEVKQKTGAEIAVVTVKTVGQDYTPQQYANVLFEKWGIGQKGKDDGVLLLDAIQERYVWIEVGYGLEGILPDGLVGEIRDRYIIPYLKKGLRGEAYLNGVRALAGVIAKNAGVQITGSVQVAYNPEARRKALEKQKKAKIIFWVLFTLFFFILPFLGGKNKKKKKGSGFWGPWYWGGGGFGGGGGGGFGGGFGGFGGGASGGGGAGGGY